MRQHRQADTIPRLHQLVAHMSAFLARMNSGEQTFEDIRRGYAETVSRLAAAGLGRRTASRVSDADAYWSPTVEVLQEAMRLELLQRQPLPSSRRHLASYRATGFKLTDRGREAAALAGRAPAEFTSRLADAAISAHPYMRSFLLTLDQGPLVCPEIREGQLESGHREGRDTSYWAKWAAELINRNSEAPVATAEAVRDEMTQAVTKRFGVSPSPRPTNKALAETLNDAFAAASLRARDLPLGATTLKVLKAWGSQLLLFDQSRYVPACADTNVVWLASDLVYQANTVTGATRRTLGQYGTPVARALIEAYWRQARGRTSNLITMPYLPIHEVRAEAAFQRRVTRALADLALERLAAGDFSEIKAQVWLHLSGGEVPNSEPIYRRGGTRRFSMTVETAKDEEEL